MKITTTKVSWLISIMAITALTTSCGMSLRMAKQHSIDQMSDESYRIKAAENSAGYQESMGLPSLAERLAKRPKIKIAVLQYGATIQGDVSRDFADITFFSAMAATYGGTFQIKELKTLDAIEVPTGVGVHLATDGLKKLESQLRRAGFDVIDSDNIVKTRAYKKYYASYPPLATVEKGDYDITSGAAGWTAFAPLNHRVKAPSGMIAIGQHHWIWPDPVALQEIADELGEDILFLAVSSVFQNHVITGKGHTRSREGVFSSSAKAGLYDPKYVGKGIGGFGHSVAGLDAALSASRRPAFLKENNGQFTVDWNMLVKEAEFTNDYYAQAFANTLKDLKTKK